MVCSLIELLTWGQIMSEDRTPSLAIPGVVLSAFGWLTCGLFCIPGILLTIGSLFQRGPKVWSFVGLLVGLPGLAFFALFGFAMMLAAVGIGGAAAVSQAKLEEAQRQAEQQQQAPSIQSEQPASIAPPRELFVSTPDNGEPPAPDYKRLPRVWTAGKFSVEASYKFKIGDKITIQRTDNGKEISVEVAKLSEEDQKWIEENLK